MMTSHRQGNGRGKTKQEQEVHHRQGMAVVAVGIFWSEAVQQLLLGGCDTTRTLCT